MATGQATSEPAAAAPRGSSRAGGRAPRYELVAYAVLAVVLVVLMWVRVREVDGWYLDEWLYVHAGRWITGHLPGGLWEAMPYWTRGPQRLYPALLGVPYGLAGTSAAFTIAHFVNVVLLASAVWPAALLARRIIEHPALRVLAVTLGVALPWLMIADHLLVENLAFPLFLWSCVAIVRVTEAPTPRNQALAIVLLGATAMARLNLGVLFVALLIAVLVREGVVAAQKDGVPWSRRLKEAARTEWLLLIAFVLIGAFAIHLLRGGTATLGDYGATATPSGIWDRLFGDLADPTRRSAMTFLRSLVMGSFVFPFALGIGAALGAATGRLGRRLIVPGVLTLVSIPLVIGGVVLAQASQEERYVFYPATLIALFAVAALEHLRRLRGWITAGGVIAVWALLVGAPGPGTTSFDFFHAPAGAFWTRVLDARMKRWEGDLLGWTLLPRTGWLLFAAGLVVLVVMLRLLLVRRGALVRGVLAGGLALCALLQVVAMQYGFQQELHGTTAVAGGIAGAPGHGERLTYIDAAMPAGASAILQPALARPEAPTADAEYAEIWSKKIDTVLSLSYVGAGVPAAAGMSVIDTRIGPDGLARWTAKLPRWLVTAPDDPRLQLPATLVAPGKTSAYAVWKLAAGDRARWTGQGIGPDGSVPPGHAATLTLDARATGATSVRLTFAAPGPQPARVTVGRSRLRLKPGATGELALRVPRGSADTAAWALRATGPARLIAAHIGG